MYTTVYVAGVPVYLDFLTRGRVVAVLGDE